MSAKFPPVAELLPHAGAMVFLSRVLEHDGKRTVCAVEIDRQELFREADGSIAAWIGVEYMAQCIATHAGLVARARQEAPRQGFLLGSRRVTLNVSRYHSGQQLRVSATHAWGGRAGMASFDCSIEGRLGNVLAEARLNCFLQKDDGDGEEV